jgi:hypothetical protein
LTAATIIPIIANGYVFWAVGEQLSLARMRQIAQPRYSAEKILGIKGEEAQLWVRELGFANIAIGCVGLARLGAPSGVLGRHRGGDILWTGRNESSVAWRAQ